MLKDMVIMQRHYCLFFMSTCIEVPCLGFRVAVHKYNMSWGLITIKHIILNIINECKLLRLCIGLCYIYTDGCLDVQNDIVFGLFTFA